MGHAEPLLATSVLVFFKPLGKFKRHIKEIVSLGLLTVIGLLRSATHEILWSPLIHNTFPHVITSVKKTEQDHTSAP
uniref:Uncharacterized protein n=1 Tax=Oreochromis niloticus TaxID=8128 RepID=A0A669EAY1_ORENI